MGHFTEIYKKTVIINMQLILFKNYPKKNRPGTKIFCPGPKKKQNELPNNFFYSIDLKI